MSERAHIWTLRSLAVAVAVGIWLPTSYLPRLEETRMRPTLIEENVAARLSIPDLERLTVLSFEPRGVEVRIRGRSEQMDSLDPGQVRVRVPLPDDVFRGAVYNGPREIEIVLGVENVRLPDEQMEAVSVAPDRLTLLVDEEISTLVPVEVTWVGEPIGGVAVDLPNVRVEPAEVTVRGSRSEINRLGSAVAGPVDITGRGLDFTAEQVRVRLGSEHVQVMSPTIVDVFVPMVSR